MSRVCRLVTALKPKGGETEGDVFSDNEQAPEHSGDVMPLAFPSPALWAGDTEEGYSQSPVELSANNNGIAIDPAILNDEAGQEVAYTEPVRAPDQHMGTFSACSLMLTVTPRRDRVAYRNTRHTMNTTSSNRLTISTTPLPCTMSITK